MIMRRAPKRLRASWPHTHILLHRWICHHRSAFNLETAVDCDLHCGRGQDENLIKQIKNDLFNDRTSAHRFLANHLRLF